MISIKGKKILVTGAAGFIGSHLTEMLLDADANVTALARYTSSGKAGWLDYLRPALRKRLKVVFGDIRDPDICRTAVGKNGFVFHLAAQIAIPYSYIAPRDFLNVNALGTANMLQASREAGVTKFLHVSTSEVYGSARYVPIDENHPQVAQSPYSASKIAADKIAQSFYLSYDSPVVTVRPFNCFGPRQSARAVMPTIVLQALKGHVIKLGNVDTRRDMNFVADVARGMMAACLSDRTSGMTLNLATGKDYSIKDMVGLVSDILGKNLSIKTEKRRRRPNKSEVQRLMGDSSLARKTIDYYSITTFRAALRKTIAFYEKHLDMYRQEDYQL